VKATERDGDTGNLISFAFISINIFHPTNFSELAMTTLSELTPRELEILQLVLDGYTNKAIAAEVFISEKTVEFHLDNIYTKIGVRTRLMASVWAIQQGLATGARETPS